ncbi:hypothetical protein ABW21_db0203860 [Orbilia brochopaga]|nr:hypothetical protein ABW21_db0203860 [Drechslerella brochopaga]
MAGPAVTCCCRQLPRHAARRAFSTTVPRLISPPKRERPVLLPGAAGVPDDIPLPILQHSPAAALARRRDPHRTGLIARKQGMTAIFDTKGLRTPCTVLQVDRCQVMSNKTPQEHGYWAVQVGAGERNPLNVPKPMLGHFAACKTSPKQVVKEFRIRNEKGMMKPGSPLDANWFRKGQLVDIRAHCKGKGFAGGMKRHGFKGQPASHGNSLTHRAMGSAGQSQGGGSRVLPGKRMAGRMGGQRVTIQLVKVLDVNRTLNTVVVKGCVPGPKNGIVEIQDAMLSHPPTISGAYKDAMINMFNEPRRPRKAAPEEVVDTAAVAA